MTEMIFGVNCITHGKKHKMVAKDLRREISKLTPKPKKMPIAWFGLEVILHDMAQKKKREVLSVLECKQAAEQVQLKDEAFTAALNHLAECNILLSTQMSFQMWYSAIPKFFLVSLLSWFSFGINYWNSKFSSHYSPSNVPPPPPPPLQLADLGSSSGRMEHLFLTICKSKENGWRCMYVFEVWEWGGGTVWEWGGACSGASRHFLGSSIMGTDPLYCPVLMSLKYARSDIGM